MHVAIDVPPDGHKSHANKLHISPEHWRRLEAIHPLMPSVDKKMTSWIDNHATAQSVDLRDLDDVQEELTIPCNPTVGFPLVKRRANTITHMIPWIENLPLQTAQCALHLLFPETTNYSFVLVEENESENLDKDIFRYFTWSDSTSASSDSSPTSRLTVAFQPPWILSDKDIQMFSRCRSFPSLRKDNSAFPGEILESQHRLWGKVWDVCNRNRTRWFVLTSYHSWVFGAFSLGWTAAFVSEVYPYDSASPSIAECLVFWTASAMRILSTASVPKVGAETPHLSYENPCTVYDMIGPNLRETPQCQVPEPTVYRLSPVSATLIRSKVDFRKVPDSESHWDGKSDDAASSAGVCFSDAGSCTSSLPGNGPLVGDSGYNTSLRQPLVMGWLAETLTVPHDTLTAPRGVEGVLRHVPDTSLGEYLL